MRATIAFYLLTTLLLTISLLTSIPPDPYQGRWLSADLDGRHIEKAALLVPVFLNHQRCYLQLDTGASDDFIWYNPQGASDIKSIELLGQTRQLPLSQYTQQQFGHCGRNPIGTLGNKFFKRGLFSINLNSGLLGYAPEASLLNTSDAVPMHFIDSGHLAFDFSTDNGASGLLIFDSGSAAADYLALSTGEWQEFTGNQPLTASDQVQVYHANSWGKTLTCYTTKGAPELKIGTKKRNDYQVDFCPELGFTPAPSVKGIVGLSFFGEATLVLDYSNQLWALKN